jgi:hypothetical protein
MAAERVVARVPEVPRVAEADGVAEEVAEGELARGHRVADGEARDEVGRGGVPTQPSSSTRMAAVMAVNALVVDALANRVCASTESDVPRARRAVPAEEDDRVVAHHGHGRGRGTSQSRRARST